ncbi:MAG: phosphatidylglycerophosphatase A family protein [Acidimicrobiia bacterium]
MHKLIASFFGSGLILRRLRGSDLGSGTVGALLALPFSIWIGIELGWAGQLAAAAIVTVVGMWACRPLAGEVGDAGWIVIDEVAGLLVSTVGLVAWPALLAFIGFRFADIMKTWFPGVHQAESLPGAFGIMTDDLIAGLYALAIGHLLNATVF